jgi:hypothetical protein
MDTINGGENVEILASISIEPTELAKVEILFIQLYPPDYIVFFYVQPCSKFHFDTAFTHRKS